MINPPIILTLNSSEKLLLEKYMEHFTGIGFEIEPFGGREYAVRAVPANLFSIAKKELLMEMIDGLSDEMDRGNSDLLNEKIASMSCKAAVKGNHRLSEAEARALIDELLELEKSLVYFTTSLRSNEVVLEKLLRTEKVKKYPEDTDLLEDVIIENKQAIEMANIYSGILSGTMDAFASVISNNLNIVMKFLATVTIVLSIPTMVASFYGMNVNSHGMPFADSPYGFGIVLVLALLLSLIVAFIFNKKDLF